MFIFDLSLTIYAYLCLFLRIEYIHLTGPNGLLLDSLAILFFFFCQDDFSTPGHHSVSGWERHSEGVLQPELLDQL